MGEALGNSSTQVEASADTRGAGLVIPWSRCGGLSSYVLSSTFIMTTIIDYIFYYVWLATELDVVYFLYVETRNTSLEEIDEP